VATSSNPSPCRLMVAIPVGAGQEPVGVQLPGVAGDPEGEGLTRPRSADDHGDPLAALAQVPDHRLLVGAGGGMGGQCLRNCLMGGPGRLVPHPAGGAATSCCSTVRSSGVDQRRSSRAQSATTLTARSAKNRSASSSSSARPAPARPAPRATKTSGRVKVDAVAFSPSGPTSRSTADH
jgi:hypothetical protein